MKLKRIGWLACVILTGSPGLGGWSFAQSPAVTLQQCHAFTAEWGTENRDDWLAQANRQLDTGQVNTNPVERLSVASLGSRIDVVDSCSSLDPGNAKLYQGFADFYYAVFVIRANLFTRRKGLFDQFAVENGEPNGLHEFVAPADLSMDTCRADLTEWRTEDHSDWMAQDARSTKTGQVNTNPVERLRLSNLKVREGLMWACKTVDPENSSAYEDVHFFYFRVFSSRILRFLRTHNLYQQFWDQDVAGIR